MHNCNHLYSSDMFRFVVSAVKFTYGKTAAVGIYAVIKIDGVPSLTVGIKLKLFRFEFWWLSPSRRIFHKSPVFLFTRR